MPMLTEATYGLAADILLPADARAYRPAALLDRAAAAVQNQARQAGVLRQGRHRAQSAAAQQRPGERRPARQWRSAAAVGFGTRAAGAQVRGGAGDHEALVTALRRAAARAAGLHAGSDAGELRSCGLAAWLGARPQSTAQCARRRHAYLSRRTTRRGRQPRSSSDRAQDRARHTEPQVPAAGILRVR